MNGNKIAVWIGIVAFVLSQVGVLVHWSARFVTLEVNMTHLTNTVEEVRSDVKAIKLNQNKD